MVTRNHITTAGSRRQEVKGDETGLETHLRLEPHCRYVIYILFIYSTNDYLQV
jgi:hypothetical protein